MKSVQNVKFITMLFGANSDAMLQSVFGKSANGVPYNNPSVSQFG